MDILKSFVRFLKKLWSAIRKVLAVVLLLASIYFFAFAAVVNSVLYGILCLGAAFLVDADTAAKAVEVTGEALGQAAGAVAGAVGDIATGATKGLLKGGVGGIAVALVAGYFGLRYLSRKVDEPTEPANARSAQAQPQLAGGL